MVSINGYLREEQAGVQVLRISAQWIYPVKQMGTRPQTFREPARRRLPHSEDASHVSAISCLASPEEDEDAIRIKT